MISKYFNVLMVIATLLFSVTGFQTVSSAQTKGEVPGQSLGVKSDADLWRYVRTGNAGSTQMKNELSAVMI